MSKSIMNTADGQATVTDPVVSNKAKRRVRYKNLKLFTFKGEDRRPGGVRHQARTETKGSIHDVPKRDRELCIDKF